MIQYVLWAVSFVSLWITLVWMNVLVLEEGKKQILKRLPKVTIAVPCFNKARFLEKTVASLAGLNYPRNLLQVVIVDDCSTDSTLAEAKRLKNKYRELDILVVAHSSNKGKAGALNTALGKAKGELFACLDADTRVHPDSLLHAVSNFSDKNLGAIISQVRVDRPDGFYGRLQHLEYLLSNFVRLVWSQMGTLFITPGVLSVYNAGVVRRLGGFDDGGLTEDLEIAMRLKANKYDVRMEPRSITYTSVPQHWSDLWRQRIRWYRGFVFNHLKYKKLFFDRSQGVFGWFQLPMNALAVVLFLASIILISYDSLHNAYEFLSRSLTIKGYFWNHVIDFPTLKELVLSQNVQVTIPIVLGSLLGAYLIYLAFRHANENVFGSLHYVAFYVLVYPYVTSLHWVSALLQEAFGMRRKW